LKICRGTLRLLEFVFEITQVNPHNEDILSEG
jgi:hypothetical protein